MKFKCNNTEYEIKEVACIEDEIETVGLTRYQEKIIYLKKLDKDFMIRTLKHELVHVWLYEYGHNQDEKEFNNEDVCEIVACSNDFINEVVVMYLGIKPLYLCDAENNIECKKKSCYINDGVCYKTTNIKYAKGFKDEH